MAEEWKAQAACAGIGWDGYFPSAAGNYKRSLIDICRQCPVQAVCLDYAMRRELHASWRWGLWGGLTPNQRADLQRRLDSECG